MAKSPLDPVVDAITVGTDPEQKRKRRDKWQRHKALAQAETSLTTMKESAGRALAGHPAAPAARPAATTTAPAQAPLDYIKALEPAAVPAQEPIPMPEPEVPPRAAQAQAVVERVAGGEAEGVAAAREEAARQVAMNQEERDARDQLNIDLITKGGDLGMGIPDAENKTVRRIVRGDLTGADGMEFQRAVSNPMVRRAFAIQQGIDPTDKIAVNEAFAAHSRRMLESQRTKLVAGEGGIPLPPSGPGLSPGQLKERQEKHGRLREAAEAKRGERREALFGTDDLGLALAQREQERRQARIETGGDVGRLREQEQATKEREALIGTERVKALGTLAQGLGTGRLNEAQIAQMELEIDQAMASGAISEEAGAKMKAGLRAGGAGGAAVESPAAPGTTDVPKQGSPGTISEGFDPATMPNVDLDALNTHEQDILTDFAEIGNIVGGVAGPGSREEEILARATTNFRKLVGEIQKMPPGDRVKAAQRMMRKIERDVTKAGWWKKWMALGGMHGAEAKKDIINGMLKSLRELAYSGKREAKHRS